MQQEKKLLVSERITQELGRMGNAESDLTNNSTGQLVAAADALMMGRFTEEGAHLCLPTGWDLKEWAKLLAKPMKERLIFAACFLAREADRLDLQDEWKANQRLYSQPCQNYPYGK